MKALGSRGAPENESPKGWVPVTEQEIWSLSQEEGGKEMVLEASRVREKLERGEDNQRKHPTLKKVLIPTNCTTRAGGGVAQGYEITTSFPSSHTAYVC